MTTVVEISMDHFLNCTPEERAAIIARKKDMNDNTWGYILLLICCIIVFFGAVMIFTTPRKKPYCKSITYVFAISLEMLAAINFIGCVGFGIYLLNNSGYEARDEWGWKITQHDLLTVYSGTASKAHSWCAVWRGWIQDGTGQSL